MEKINKQTLIGIACSHCGTVTDDPKVLNRAIYRSWNCPLCGARNLSLNDVAAASHVIEVRQETEPQPAEDEEAQSALLVQSTPEELERLRREFLEKKSL